MKVPGLLSNSGSEVKVERHVDKAECTSQLESGKGDLPRIAHDKHEAKMIAAKQKQCHRK